MPADALLALLVAVTALFWFAPAIIAGRRLHPSRYAIFAGLLFVPCLAFAGAVGWLLMAVAWIGAVVWCLTGAPSRGSGPAAA